MFFALWRVARAAKTAADKWLHTAKTGVRLKHSCNYSKHTDSSGCMVATSSALAAPMQPAAAAIAAGHSQRFQDCLIRTKGGTWSDSATARRVSGYFICTYDHTAELLEHQRQKSCSLCCRRNLRQACWTIESLLIAASEAATAVELAVICSAVAYRQNSASPKQGQGHCACQTCGNSKQHSIKIPVCVNKLYCAMLASISADGEGMTFQHRMIVGQA